MRLSRYVVAYVDALPGEHVLYDVIGDRYVGIDDALLAGIRRWESAPPSDEAGREAQRTLAEMGFVVAGDAEDDARLDESWRASAEGISGTTYVTWMPTLACNLACTYCFQKDHPLQGRMSAETEAETLAFVLRKVDAARTRRLVVHYIGGEPLAHRELVLRTASALSRAMADRGGSFGWELTTNGVGLDPGFVDALLAAGEGVVKVTLDGDRETHDAARVYRSGRGSFDEVFDALVTVARECPAARLRVGGNFVAGQQASYERLLDRMERAGLRGRLESVYFKPILDTDSPSGGCAGCASAPQETQTLVQIGRSVERRGLGKRPLPFIDTAGLCELHWNDAWVVDPSGRVYRCLAVAGRPEMAIGDVRSDATRADPLTATRPWERHEPCRTCAYLPVCGGGCLGGRHLQTGRTGEVLCRLERFEKSFRDEVVARYIAEFHASGGKQAA